MRLLSISLLLLFTVAAGANGTRDSVAVKYAETITSNELSEHLNILASDEYEGRETGLAGQKKAAEYISNHFQKLGLPPIMDEGYFQQFPLELQDNTGVSISIGKNSYDFIDDFYFFSEKGSNLVTSSEVVFAGYGIDDVLYNDYYDINIKDKVVMILDGEPHSKDGKSYVDPNSANSQWRKRRDLKVITAAEKGAAAVLTVMRNYDAGINDFKQYLRRPRMKLAGSQSTSGPLIPNYYISERMAESILANQKKSIKKIKKVINKRGLTYTYREKSGFQVKNAKETQTLMSENVLGYIEGGDKKDELVVITAHYDHIGMKGDKIFNGADDDGSGTVALLEIAEAFAKAKAEGKGPRRSVLVMPVSGEEKGLLGSRYYVENPVFDLESTVADLNIDMIGRLDEKHADNSNYVYLIGSDKLSTELHEISERANETYTGLDLDYTFNDPEDPNRFYYRSDHYNFAKNKIPVIFYFNGVHEDYHKHTDTVEKIDFNKIEKISRLVFHTAWDLANREKRIEVDVDNDFK